MNQTPDIPWLSTEWGLPSEAARAVMSLTAAAAEGSTACIVTEPLPEWGNAAADAEADAITPLVLIKANGHTYLQSRRLFDAESTIARKLAAFASRTLESADEALLGTLFPHDGHDDMQRRAVRMVKERRLTVISGGPGTGKTFTSTRALAYLLAQGTKPSAIRIAAPTGKAADRVRSSVSATMRTLPVDFPVDPRALRSVAESCGTLHRLLAYNPVLGRCRYNTANRLPCSVLLIDECSMVDVFAWRAVLDALPDDARLVLVGDSCQLESVGIGNVFRELVEWRVSGSGPLADCIVELGTFHRFESQSALGQLGQMIRAGDADGVVAMLANARSGSGTSGLCWVDSEDQPLSVDQLPPPVREQLEGVAAAATPEEALRLLSRVCVLSAQRRFAIGADAINLRIDRHFVKSGHVRNRPIIISTNDPATDLHNGSVGIIHRELDGTQRAWFEDAAGALRSLPVSKLPDHNPAWAITIHRSQGSEYDDVFVSLPREESPLATRELLYTAITRARRNLWIAGDLAAVRSAVSATSKRCTMISRAFEAAGSGFA
ncbi:MAG: exodeoxyribonuclease V subunit alpha [Chthoniobacterales bacterium]|nr:exodeoxyribonuclease V subunit alpha [Chthoniobacterales bacterium]